MIGIKKTGIYIVLEGVDLAGKSTIAEKLVNKLKSETSGVEIYHAREPGHTGYGKEMREVLHSKPILDVEDEVKAAQLMLLDRLENTTTISGKLREGAIVVQERNFLTALAYNEAGDTEEVQFIQKCNKASLKPDVLYFIDINQNTVENRLKERAKEFKLDAYENLNLIMRRRANYLNFSNYIDVICVNNNDRDKDDIVNSIFKQIKLKLGE